MASTLVMRDAYGDVFASQFTCAGNVVITAQGTSYQYYNTNAPGKLRWALGMTTDAETGSNAGSNWNLWVYNDAGTYLGTAIAITRATMATTFFGPLGVSSLANAAGLGTNAPTASTLVARDANAQSQFITVYCGGTGAGAVQMTGGDSELTGRVQFLSPTGVEAAYIGAGAVNGEVDIYCDGTTNFCFRAGATTGTGWLYCFMTPSSTTGAVVTVDAAQTLTSKTINCANNTISNIPNSALNGSTAATANTVALRDGSGNLTGYVVYAAQVTCTGNLVSCAQGAGLQFYNTNAAGKCRWAAILSTGAETGGNAGSGWQLWAYSDTGVALGMPFEIVRANQAVYFYGPGPYITNPQNYSTAAVTCAGAQTLSNKTLTVGSNTCQITGKGDLISTGVQSGSYTANLTINGATPGVGLYTIRCYIAVASAGNSPYANLTANLNWSDGIGSSAKTLMLTVIQPVNSNSQLVENQVHVYSNGSAISVSVAYSGGSGSWEGFFQIICA